MVDFRELYKDGENAPVRVGLVGAGEFGASLITQSLSHPRIEVPVVADIDPDRAVNVLLRCGVGADAIDICRDAGRARDAVAAGRVAVVPDGLLLIDTDIEVVVEATGAPRRRRPCPRRRSWPASTWSWRRRRWRRSAAPGWLGWRRKRASSTRCRTATSRAC